MFEVESELIAAHKLGYLDEETLQTTRAAANEVGRMLMGLIRYVRRRELQERRSRSSAHNPQLATRNSQLTPHHPRGYLDEETLQTTRAAANEVDRMLMGLIRYVRRRELQERRSRSSARNSQPATRNSQPATRNLGLPRFRARVNS